MESSLVNNQQSAVPLPASTVKAYLFVLLTVALMLTSVIIHETVLFMLVYFGLLIFGLSLFRFEAACLLVPTVIANPLRLTDTGTRLVVSEFVLLILFCSFFIQFVLHPRRYHISKEILFPAAIITLAAAASLTKAHYSREGMLQLIRIIEVLIIFSFMITNVFVSRTSIKRMFVAIIFAGAVASLVGIFQFLTESAASGTSRRVFGLLGGGYGAVISSSLISCIGVFLYEKERGLRSIAMLAAPLLTIALIVSQTRAWIGAFIISVIILLFMLNRRYLVKAAAATFILFSSLGLFIITDGFGIVDTKYFVEALSLAFRFGKTAGEYSIVDTAMVLRLVVWTFSIGVFLANPIFGIGIGNLRFSSYVPPTITAPMDGAGFVDSQYIMVFVETGIIGGLAWLWLYGTAIRSGAKIMKLPDDSDMKSVSFGLFGSFLIFLIGGGFWTISTYHELFVFHSLIIALLISTGNLGKELKEPAV